MAKLPQLFRATVRVFNLEMQKIQKIVTDIFTNFLMNFLLSFVLKSLDSRVETLSKRNGEKIESYCKSPFFKLEMHQSTSKQPYIFEIETKLLSPTLYSSYIMLPTFFCKNGILLPKLF